MDTRKRFSPAAERNAKPIAEVLQTVLPASGVVLEVASGSGQHAVSFAKTFPQLRWQPTERDLDARWSIDAYCAEASLPNLLPPKELDVLARWGVNAKDSIVAIVAINFLHIAPWIACERLFEGAARILPRDAVVVIYGPFVVPGRETASSNLDFHQTLRDRDVASGLRDMNEVFAEAEKQGFRGESVFVMPANNYSVVFRKV